MTLMDRPRAVLRHLFRNLLRRERVERELSQELDDYLAMLVEEKVAAGMSHDAARRAARLEFGGRDQVSERVRDVRIGTWLVNLIQDVRYGIRMSRRRFHNGRRADVDFGNRGNGHHLLSSRHGAPTATACRESG